MEETLMKIVKTIWNNPLIVGMVLYLIIFLYISIKDMISVKTFDDYAVAGKNQGQYAVTMTLLATILGASTTIGIGDTVYKIGFPGIWWLVFGAVGLILQSLLLSVRVRSIGADTLPDLARRIVGRPAELIISIIIVVSWVGVIAGQLVAMYKLISFAIGKNSRIIFIIVSVIVILYTLFGGQMSVVKTDRLQLYVILAGVFICCGYLYFVKGGNTAAVANNIELLNKDYKPINLLMQFFMIGGVYFLGPDIMSRNFLSRDEDTAKRATFVAGLALILISIVVTLIGMWVRYNALPDAIGDSSAFMYVIAISPKLISILLTLGLLSAILSSTDTCLINASTILVRDIMGKQDIRLIRRTVAVIGAIALLLALLGNGDIMTLLTGAYTIYTPGIIFPLTVAIFVNDKDRIRVPVWVTAVAIGGVVGLMAAYLPKPLSMIGVPESLLSYMTLIAMGLSLVISLFSVKRD